jgi:hypothetical protein
MAKTYQWLPRKNNTGRRGLEVTTSGTLEWAFVPMGKKRETTVFLNQKVARKDIEKSSDIVDVVPSRTSFGGLYPVVIKAKAIGDTTLTVGGARLKIAVHPRRTVKVAFRNVLNDPAGTASDWKTKFTDKDVLRMLGVANAIYSWQGNLRFEPVGAVQAVKSEIVGAQEPEDFKDHVDPKAHVTTFFVDDYGGSGPGAWARSWKKLILLEAGIKKNVFDLVFCHEMGHFLGLPHPTGTPYKNLMNQTSKAATYGGRHRYGSNLIRSQIETIVQPCKWKNPGKHKCST